MNITKQQLKQIIKEEYQKLTLEQEDWAGSEIERERRRVSPAPVDGGPDPGPLPDVEGARRVVADRIASLWKIMHAYGEEAEPALGHLSKIIQHLNAGELAPAVSGVEDLIGFLEMVARPAGDGGVSFFGRGGDHSGVLTAVQKIKSALDALQLGGPP